MPQSPIGEITDSSMKNLQALIDANAVIGQAITTPEGTTILPVCKVSFGFASGGSDLPSSQREMFGGGQGGGVSITPIAFLVIKGGDVRLMQVQSYSNTVDRAVGMVPEMVDKVSGLVSSFKKTPEEAAPAQQPETPAEA